MSNLFKGHSGNTQVDGIQWCINLFTYNKKFVCKQKEIK